MLPAAADAQPSDRGRSVAVAPRTLWLAAGILALAVGVWVLLTAGMSVLLLLFTAIIIAEALRPIAKGLNVRWHIPLPAGILLLYLIIVLIACALVLLLAESLASQVGAFAAALPGLGTEVRYLLQEVHRGLGNGPEVDAALQSVGNQTGVVVQDALEVLVGIPQLLGGVLFAVVVVAAMAFFWLTSVAGLRPFVLSLLPADSQPLVTDMLTDVSRRLGGYVRGIVVNMVVIGLLSTLGVWLLGGPFPLVLGLVAALTQVIPFFGPWISGAFVLLVVAPLAGPLKAGEIIAFYVVLQTIVGNTLTPLILADAVHINPLLSIVAVLLGSQLLGLTGAVLGVPIAAVLQVVVVRVLAPLGRRAAARANQRASILQASGGDQVQSP
jgi:predicted PurR-regulated permease PerM